MKNIILDTDIDPDCDDGGALALLNAYADTEILSPFSMEFAAATAVE